MKDEHKKVSIRDFFRGKCVLITGATGFLGGVLLEKLLRSCPEIDTIFLVVRGKVSENIQKRIDLLLQSQLFSAHDEESLKKVIGLKGDLSKSELNMNSEDLDTLRTRVQVVFHVAATVSFNANLKSAVSTNLGGTERVLELCHQMPHLKAFVYTSTAYCNAFHHGCIQERVYPTSYNPQDIIQLIEQMTVKEAMKATPRLLENHPNTYSFTKHLAENLIIMQKKNIPVAIIRPSIVLGTYEQPFPGWVGNVKNGALAFVAGAGKGIFRAVMADSGKVADLVPCDHVVNLLIAAAWNAATDRNTDLIVYHCCSGDSNSITWGEYTRLAINAVRQYPSEKMFWYPGAQCRISWIRNFIAIIIVHYIPALLFGTFSFIIGKESS